MKKIIALMVTILFASSVNAEGDKAENMALCMQFNDVAKGIMQHRQNGVELSTLLKGMTNPSDSEEQSKAVDMAVTIIKAAYDTPRFRTHDAQQRAITEFANDVLLTCMKKFVE